MASRSSKPALGTRGQPERTRAAILQAAMREFAQEGIAGARIDAIAQAARVNKALLYYYFKDKETLYGAVLDEVFGGLIQRVLPALESNLPPRQKILSYVQTHFDYVASSPLYPRLVQGEWMRAGRSRSSQVKRIAERYFRPLFAKLGQVLAEGVAAGEFRPVDPRQFVPSMIAVIVFYFVSLPVIRQMVPGDPLSPERIAARRAAVQEFISAALLAKPVDAGVSGGPGPADGSVRQEISS